MSQKEKKGSSIFAIVSSLCQSSLSHQFKRADSMVFDKPGTFLTVIVVLTEPRRSGHLLPGFARRQSV
jgi:hypothetical protein